MSKRMVCKMKEWVKGIIGAAVLFIVMCLPALVELLVFGSVSIGATQ